MVDYSDDLFGEDGKIITDKYDELVEDSLKHPKWTYYTIDMPHKPPAIPNQDEREGIWVDVIEDDARVCEVAEKCGYPRNTDAEVVVKIIFDDFTEFYFPLIRKDSVYDNLMADYMPNVDRLNDDVDWNGDIENFSVGEEIEQKESITVDDMFGDSTDDSDDIDIDIDIEV